MHLYKFVLYKLYYYYNRNVLNSLPVYNNELVFPYILVDKNKLVYRYLILGIVHLLHMVMESIPELFFYRKFIYLVGWTLINEIYPTLNSLKSILHWYISIKYDDLNMFFSQINNKDYSFDSEIYIDEDELLRFCKMKLNADCEVFMYGGDCINCFICNCF